MLGCGPAGRFRREPIGWCMGVCAGFILRPSRERAAALVPPLFPVPMRIGCVPDGLPKIYPGTCPKICPETCPGSCPKEPREGAPDGSEKRPERPSGKSCKRRSGKPADGAPGSPANGVPGNPANDVPGSPATASLGRLGARHPGPRTRRSPRARRPEPVLFGCGRTFFCYSNNGIRNISVNLSRNKSAKERFQ